MRVMVIVKATNDSEDGKLPTPELFEQMGAFNQQLMDAGIFVDGGRGEAKRQGRARRLFRSESLGDQGPVPRCPRTRFGLLDLEGQGPQRGDRLGQALPQSRCPGRRSSKSVSFMRWKTSTSPSKNVTAELGKRSPE